MFYRSKSPSTRRAATVMICSAILIVFITAGSAIAHPPGQFTINHFSRLEVAAHRGSVRSLHARA